VDQFKSLPVALLGAAAGISILTGGLGDAVVILAVVLINAGIGFTTENQSEKTILSLKNLVKPSALVIREQRLQEIKAEDVVVGDILVLRNGSYICADARLLEIHHLSVDESVLTGESMPVFKDALPIIREGEIPLADRANMVYMGTLVTGGQGMAVVVATGRFTEMGRIQVLTGEARPPETPMERQLDQMGRQLVFVSGIICGAVFLIGLLRGYGLLQMLKSSISLAVAAVPEGLPAVATTTLAIGVRQMRRHKVLMRHLAAVETLGSVQTICLDKTGTLTENRMSVVALHTGLNRLNRNNGGFLRVNGCRFNGPPPDGAPVVHPYNCDDLLRLIHVSVLCNETEINGNNGTHCLRGSSTENALVQMALEEGIDVAGLKKRHPILKVIHRSENRNLMITMHENPGEEGRLIAIKGSPREVLSLSRSYFRDGVRLPLSDEARGAIDEENERMAGEALRVLGMAYAVVQNDLPLEDLEKSEILSEHLIWLGLVGMADPIRMGVKDLMKVFHRAGIETVMITGDQSPTAYAIGKELDLSRGGQLEILDSTHLSQVPPEVMKALCREVHVFARVSPSHKLQIVQALQGAGRVVAMTGDGINDGPALKAADIGVAMGRTGTDVAREVADVVLEDDELETMVVAIRQGRTIYNNIRKSVHFLLATNLSEIMVMFTGLAAGLGQPLSTIQLLWINLMSDIFPGLALALESPEPDILNQPPRDPREPIIRAADLKGIALEAGIISAGALGAYGYGIMRYGMEPRANSLAFLSLTTAQILHALSCRSEKPTLLGETRMPPNRYLDLAVGGTLLLQAGALMIPPLRRLLGISPLSLADYLVVGGAALAPLLMNERVKGARCRNRLGEEKRKKEQIPRESGEGKGEGN
jgi:Ca2+-transporting ATPase